MLHYACKLIDIFILLMSFKYENLMDNFYWKEKTDFNNMNMRENNKGF